MAGVMASAYNPSTGWHRQEDVFKNSLGYTARARPAYQKYIIRNEIFICNMAWLNFQNISRDEILTRLKFILSLIWYAMNMRCLEQLIVAMITQLCDHVESHGIVCDNA